MPINFKSQSTLHVGIIMDGNGRWATGRGLPRIMGHRAGVEAARRVVEAAPGAGVGILTLFAFSSDNWRRPPAEVDALMRLMAVYLENETSRCVAQGVRLEVIGRRDRLGAKLCSAIAQAEAATSAGDRLWFRRWTTRRDAIRAARGLRNSPRRPGRAMRPPVNLLITGGERGWRFQLWESATPTRIHAHHVAGFRRDRAGGCGAQIQVVFNFWCRTANASLPPEGVAGLRSLSKDAKPLCADKNMINAKMGQNPLASAFIGVHRQPKQTTIPLSTNLLESGGNALHSDRSAIIGSTLIARRAGR
jgi:undecaprenyl diphosphate synthase